MLTNAKKMRQNYLDRVEEAAMDIVNVITELENSDSWESEMDEYYCLNVLFYIDGDYNYAERMGVDITEVYDFLSTLIVPEISANETVIEALSEIFEIDCDSCSFELQLKGYSAEENE